jgi:hypothetical protein
VQQEVGNAYRMDGDAGGNAGSDRERRVSLRIAIDTNVLVRFLAKDDERQPQLATTKLRLIVLDG